MITKFNPNDVEIHTVDVWPFDTNTEEVVIKIRVGEGYINVRVLVDTEKNKRKPVIGSVEVIDYEYP